MRGFILMAGQAATPEKQARCNAVLQNAGWVLDPNSPVRAELWLMEGGNRLRVISARRGVVVDQPRPGGAALEGGRLARHGWGVEHLCADALQNLAWVASQGG